jgi:DNA-binding CsgD family transcriptional regulator
MRGHLVVNLVGTLLWMGALDEAEAELTELDADLFGHLAHLVALRRAQIACARGDWTSALGPLEQAEESVRGLHPNLHVTAPDHADALDGGGSRDEAIALTRDLVAASERLDAPFGRGMHRTTLGRLTADAGELERAVADLAASPYGWYEARARLELGSVLRRAGRRVECREHLRLALDYAERNGARTIAERAREELRLTGARPRRTLMTGADALTPAEARIARLAADGMTNKQIAQHLFVTVGTVQTTLVHVYRKLGVGSRRDLAAALDT